MSEVVPLFLSAEFQKYFSMSWTMIPLKTPPVSPTEEEAVVPGATNQTELIQKMKQDYFDRNESSPLHRVVYDISTQVRPSKELEPSTKIEFQNLTPIYSLSNPQDTTLQFESRFESGNLLKATQIFEWEYDLKLHYDTNTLGHTQWFYFSIQNMKSNTTYKFNIINLMKLDSLFNQGLLPVVFSCKEFAKSGRGWHHSGINACYWENDKLLPGKNGSFFKTLTFFYNNVHSDDIVYFAHCYPYTYTDLHQFLQSLQKDETKNKLFTLEELCQTISGNSCPILTITEPASEYQLKSRQGVIVSARVHPGESNSSWMVQGLIKFLLDTDNSLAQYVRSHYIVKIVPMLNPDGVIAGNYRCCVSGVDLNRAFKDPDKFLHPTIYHFSKMVKKFCEERNVVVCVDLHGHSKKKNIFMYGCSDRIRSKRLEIKLFPKMLASHPLAKTLFSFEDCSFNLSSSKDQTARVVFYSLYNIVHCYTLEASFLGSSKSNTFYGVREYEVMGEALIHTLVDFESADKRKSHKKQLEKLFPVKSNKSSILVEEETEVSQFKKSQQSRMEHVANVPLSPIDRTRFNDAMEDGSVFSVGSDSDSSDYSLKKRKKLAKRSRKSAQHNKSLLVEVLWKEPKSDTINAVLLPKAQDSETIDSDTYYNALVESTSEEEDAKPKMNQQQQKTRRRNTLVLWVGLPIALFVLGLISAIYSKNLLSR